MPSHRPWCLLGWTVCLLLLAVGRPRAQGADGRFDPIRDLPGYEEAFLGEDSDLYDFEAFEARSGKKLDAGRVAELKALWDQERARVKALLDGMDPVQRFLQKRQQALEKHPFFKRVRYEIVADWAPIYFFVQSQDKVPDYARKTARLYAAWLTALLERFETDYVQPFGLVRKRGYDAYAVAILATEGDYDNYVRAVKNPGLKNALAFYDRELRLAVINESPFSGHDESEKRSTTLHEFVHVLQHAYHTGGDGPPEYVWFTEGLAEYLSQIPRTAARPAPGIYGALDTETLGAVARLGSQGALLPLDVLMAAQSYAEVQRQATQLGFHPDVALPILYSQSSLLMHFLHQRTGPDGTNSGRKLVETALRGRAGPKSLTSAVAGGDQDALAREFADFLGREYAARFRQELGAVKYAGHPPAAADARPGTAASAPAADLPDPCAALAAPADLALLRRLALWRATEGRYDAALVLLGSPAAAGDPAIEQERRRIEALRALRRAVLDELAASGKEQALTWGGRSLRGRVLEVEDTTLTLQSGRSDPTELPLEAFDPWLLVKAAADDAPERQDPEALAYAWALVRDEQRRANVESRIRRATGEPGAAIMDDAPVYDDLLQPAAVLGALDAVFGASAKGFADPEEVLLPELEELLSQHRADRWVAGLVDCLESLARDELGRVYDASPPGARSFAGTTEELGGGRLRITYDFSDTRELEDWKETPDYMESSRGDGPALQAKTSVAIESGALVLRGATCLRGVAALAGPSSVEWDVSWRTVPGVVMDYQLLVAICDDGYESNVACVDLGGLLQAFDKQQAFLAQDGAEGTLVFDTGYRLRLEHDGQKQVRLLLDGREVASVPCGPRLQGHVVLWTHSDLPIAISSIVLEGQLAASFAADQRQAWVEERIASWR